MSLVLQKVFWTYIYSWSEDCREETNIKSRLLWIFRKCTIEFSFASFFRCCKPHHNVAARRHKIEPPLFLWPSFLSSLVPRWSPNADDGTHAFLPPPRIIPDVSIDQEKFPLNTRAGNLWVPMLLCCAVSDICKFIHVETPVCTSQNATFK